MNSDIKGREYATKDIANIVDIAESTVRKYSQALEKAGYKFLKNENGFRVYTDKDVLTFNEMKNTSKKSGMPVEKISEMIVFNQRQELQHESLSDTVKIIQSESENSHDIAPYDVRYSELISKLDKLDMLDDIARELEKVKALNKTLIERMDQQSEYIKQSLERRDQRLLESLREIQESQRPTIAAASEEQPEKKGFFKRLFGQ